MTIHDTDLQRLQRHQAANSAVIAAYRDLVAALGGPELVDAYRNALAERLRATCYGWGHMRVTNDDIRAIVDWAACEVEREIRL
ncbi:hypothetical protein ACFY7C_19435 [Streptomyces sp. NPDC012769]|uniref:hypothetical protein n=1 Tax=Streptomyces sp. NPDC012769 TaxID=3364848 RepID=UPI00369CB8FC